MSDCIFCQIVAGKIPAKVLYQDEDVMAFHDINPAAPVHILIVPRRHSRDILELVGKTDQSLAVFKALPAIAEAAGGKDSGFRLINNCGKEGGQTVDHVHFHLIGGRTLDEKLV